MTITICMGSSCFSRGNSQNAAKIQDLVDKLGIASKVELKGCLCEGECKKGPNIRINDTLHTNVSPEMLEDILLLELSREKKA